MPAPPTKNEPRYRWRCEKCGAAVSTGFARCQTAGCNFIRPEFQALQHVVGRKQLRCVESGALTDVLLPCGDPLWAPSLLGYIRAGWLDEELAYTDKYLKAHPSARKKR